GQQREARPDQGDHGHVQLCRRLFELGIRVLPLDLSSPPRLVRMHHSSSSFRASTRCLNRPDPEYWRGNGGRVPPLREAPPWVRTSTVRMRDLPCPARRDTARPSLTHTACRRGAIQPGWRRTGNRLDLRKGWVEPRGPHREDYLHKIKEWLGG